MRSVALTLLAMLLVGNQPARGQSPDVILTRARAASIAGRVEEARRLYAQAFEGYSAADNTGGQGTVKVHLSDLAVREQNLDRAVQLRREAYDLFQSAKLGFSQALTLRDLALLYFVKQDFDGAAEFCRPAVAIFEHLGAPHEAAITRLLWLQAMNQNRYVDAPTIIAQARLLLQTPASELDGIAHVAGWEAIAYGSYSLGDWQTALDAYDHCIALAEKLPDASHSREFREVGKSNRATCLMYVGRAPEALVVFQDVARKRLDRGDRTRAVMSLISAGVAARYSGKLDESEAFLSQAEKLIGFAALDPALRFRFSLNRGRLDYERGKFSSAIQQFEVAAQTIKTVPQDFWRLRYFHARALEKSGRTSEAEEMLTRALETLEQERSRAWEYRQRATYFESRADVFSSLVALLVRRNASLEALHVVEQHKSRNLLDLLSRSDASGGPEESLLSDPTDRVFSVLEKSNDERTRGVVKSLKGSAPRRKPATTVTRADTSLPEAHRAQSTTSVQQCLTSSECVLEFYLSNEASFAFLITKKDVHVWTLPVTRHECTRLVQDYRHSIEVQQPESQNSGSRKLWSVLLEPLASRLTETHAQTLYIVPDGPLHALPWAALSDSQGKLLSEQFAIALLPSSSAMVLLSRRARQTGVSGNLLSVVDSATDLPKLPAARKEADRLGSLFPRKVVLAGAEATKPRVMEQLNRSQILHFGVHGKLDADVPQLSTLFLAGNTSDLSLHLTASEISKQTLVAELAMLSSCESGLGAGRTRDYPLGDDIEGLSRAFLAAGVPKVVGTLWRVSDESTADLMVFFVERHLRDGLPSAEALRRAQAAVRSQPGRSNPYFWSGICLFGLNR